MALDFSKLHDAIGKVADLAKAHADNSAVVAQHKAEMADAQTQVDALVEQLLAAAGTPAEQHGIAAVASALGVSPAPGVTPVAPATPAVAPVVTPYVAPAAPAATPTPYVAATVTPMPAPVAPVAPPKPVFMPN
jgi:hypothetical protein